MALEPARHGLEAELAAIGAFGAQVEPGDTEPARDDVLRPVASLEDPQDARLELLASSLGTARKSYWIWRRQSRPSPEELT